MSRVGVRPNIPLIVADDLVCGDLGAFDEWCFVVEDEHGP